MANATDIRRGHPHIRQDIARRLEEIEVLNREFDLRISGVICELNAWLKYVWERWNAWVINGMMAENAQRQMTNCIDCYPAIATPVWKTQFMAIQSAINSLSLNAITGLYDATTFFGCSEPL